MKTQYKNEDITIQWDQSKCIHAGVCVRSLPNVYNPKERPWVKIENASTSGLAARHLATNPEAIACFWL